MKSEILKQVDSYKYLFRIENLLRVAMHSTLNQRFGANYFSTIYLPEFKHKEIHGKINLIKHVEKRLRTEQHLNIILGFVYPELWQIDFKLLICTLDYYWDNYFKNIFKSSVDKNILISKLMSLSNIRNAVAHNRYISDFDLDELKRTTELLEIKLVQTYVFDYENIVFNPKEKLYHAFVEVISEIKQRVKSGKIINCSMKHRLTTYYSILSTDFFGGVFDTSLKTLIKKIDDYNSIPRLPGNKHFIDSFVSEQSIIEDLNHFMI